MGVQSYKGKLVAEMTPEEREQMRREVKEMHTEGVKRGGKYTFKQPSAEEIAGIIFAVVQLDAESMEDRDTVRLYEAAATKLLKKYEIRERLLDGKPIKR